MAGLDPAINEKKPVDPRAKPGDDDLESRFAESSRFGLLSGILAADQHRFTREVS